MTQNNPNVSFLFPYRWLKEDREFLHVNLANMVVRQVGNNAEDDLADVLSYRILVSYHYKEPIVIPLTKADMNKAFKKIFKNARCLDVNVKYTQHESKTLLPLCDMQFFFRV